MGCRPVLYLSNEETQNLGVPKDELWRVVRFEVTEEGWISWLHEREWRMKGSCKLPVGIPAVLVKTTTDASNLARRLVKNPAFKCKPKSIIPLNVICQGLLKA